MIVACMVLKKNCKRRLLSGWLFAFFFKPGWYLNSLKSTFISSRQYITLAKFFKKSKIIVWIVLAQKKNPKKLHVWFGRSLENLFILRRSSLKKFTLIAWMISRKKVLVYNFDGSWIKLFKNSPYIVWIRSKKKKKTLKTPI